MDLLVWRARLDTMGMSRMTTVSAQIGMPRMAEASRMAQSTRFSPKSLTVALVMLMAAPVSSRTLPRMHPSTMTMAMLFSVSAMPLLMMPSILSHGVPMDMARMMVATRILVTGWIFHFEMKSIISKIQTAKATNT